MAEALKQEININDEHGVAQIGNGGLAIRELLEVYSLDEEQLTEGDREKYKERERKGSNEVC